MYPHMPSRSSGWAIIFPRQADLPHEWWALGVGLSGRAFELGWGDVAQGQVPTTSVIELLNVIRNRRPRRITSRVPLVIDQLGLQRSEEALHGCVLIYQMMPRWRSWPTEVLAERRWPEPARNWASTISFALSRTCGWNIRTSAPSRWICLFAGARSECFATWPIARPGRSLSTSRCSGLLNALRKEICTTNWG